MIKKEIHTSTQANIYMYIYVYIPSSTYSHFKIHQSTFYFTSEVWKVMKNKRYRLHRYWLKLDIVKSIESIELGGFRMMK